MASSSVELCDIHHGDDQTDVVWLEDAIAIQSLSHYELDAGRLRAWVNDEPRSPSPHSQNQHPNPNCDGSYQQDFLR